MKHYLYLTFCLLFLCSCGNVSTILAKANPQGTTQQQIEYHKSEIKKYKSLINQEEHNAQRSLSRRDMIDVRKANERKAKYLEKMDEHTKELERLTKERRQPPTISLIASAADELKYLNEQIQSLTQLKEYYVAKSTRAKNRASRLEFQGFQDEAANLYQEADNYDEIVEKIDSELNTLQSQKAKLSGNAKLSQLSQV